ncbi:MAG: lysophospholipid acyltransferase family protein, partial [Bacteroidales bacterium]|nr:lysophospholipid acyltransferase family protein [Bacteroidales bacterium]
LKSAFWLDFLNHDTACIHGPEAYAKKMNLPALYMRISKPKRGHYTLTFEKLIDNPQQYEPGEITRIYFKHLEDDINACPEYWLWSHRRWKHKRENYD